MGISEADNNKTISLAAETKDLGAPDRKHDQEIEWFVLGTLGCVVVASFAFHLIYLIYIWCSKGGSGGSEGVNFASSAGQTALGALVAVIARRNNGKSKSKSDQLVSKSFALIHFVLPRPLRTPPALLGTHSYRHLAIAIRGVVCLVRSCHLSI